MESSEAKDLTKSSIKDYCERHEKILKRVSRGICKDTTAKKPKKVLRQDVTRKLLIESLISTQTRL